MTNKSSKDIPICEGPVSWITKHTVLSKIKESGHKETPKNSFQEFAGGPAVTTLTLTAEGLCSIAGQGTKIPQAAWHSQKKFHFI